MASNGFGVSGFKQLDRKLARLANAPQRKKVDAILRAGANVIAREERRLIPVVEGDHRRSITVTNRPGFELDGMGPRDVSIFIGPRRGGAGSTMHLLEWGSAHARAHPFARPAVDTKGGEAIGVVIAGLQMIVRDSLK